MRFLVDAQLPPALARRLAALGHDAEHVADCGLLTASDGAIRFRAVTTAAVVITKDQDFVVYQQLHGGPAVVWIRLGNTRRQHLLDHIERRFSDVVEALEGGESLVELS